MFTCVHRLGPFIDQHPTLCALLDDPRISGAFASVLGDDFTYWGSDGNLFAGNTGCTPPSFSPTAQCLILAGCAGHSDSDWGVSELPSRSHHGERPREYVKMVRAHSAHHRLLRFV